MNVLKGYIRQSQQKSNWCWAAVAASVSDHYKKPAGRQQCEIASALLTGISCPCPSSAKIPAACNQEHSLELALDVDGHRDSETQGHLSTHQCDIQIHQDRPLGVAIEFPGGSRNTHHFLAITGVDTINDLVEANDPWYGTSIVPHADLLPGTAGHGSYQGKGWWCYSYFTKG